MADHDGPGISEPRAVPWWAWGARSPAAEPPPLPPPPPPPLGAVSPPPPPRGTVEMGDARGLLPVGAHSLHLHAAPPIRAGPYAQGAAAGAASGYAMEAPPPPPPPVQHDPRLDSARYALHVTAAPQPQCCARPQGALIAHPQLPVIPQQCAQPAAAAGLSYRPQHVVTQVPVGGPTLGGPSDGYVESHSQGMTCPPPAVVYYRS